MKANTLIYIHENIDKQKLDWADYREDFDKLKFLDFIEFKEYLLAKGYGRVDLKFINLSSEKVKIAYEQIEVELLTRDDYNWLMTFEWGVSKYIEVVAVDKRMMAA